MNTKILKSIALGLLSLSLIGCETSSDNELTAPIIELNEDVISWSKIENASKYAVYENNQLLTTVIRNEYQIVVDEIGEYEYYVVAKGNDPYKDSKASNKITYVCSSVATVQAPTLTINNKLLSWNAIEGANYYAVNMNGTYLASANLCSYQIGNLPVGGYTFTVQAVTNKGTSDHSNKVVYKNTEGVSVCNANSWDKTTMNTDWTITGDVDSSVNEGFDMLADSQARIYKSITNTNKFLTISIRTFVRDGEVAPMFYVRVNGEIIKEMDSANQYVSPYSDEAITYAYELSEFVGQDVFITLSQKDGTHCCLTSVNMVETYGPTLARCLYWNDNELFDDWLTNGVATLNEGPDLKGNGSASVRVKISEKVNEFNVQLRMFVGQDTKDANFFVRVNGDIISPKDSLRDHVILPHTTDETTNVTYDLSKYIGQEVRVKISSESPEVNHCVVLYCAFTGTNGVEPVSENSHWVMSNNDDLYEWTLKKCQVINEGVDLKNSGKCSIKIKVTSELAYMKVKARMFVGQDTQNARMLMMVNNVPTVPFNGDSEIITLDSSIDNSSYFQFDLSYYVGSTVTILFRSTNTQVNHCVLEEVTLMTALEN